METSQDIYIKTNNNSTIVASVHHPKEVKGAVMIAPATGIKRRFYHSLAQFLCKNGYGVITYENTGIGDSLTGNIKNCTVTLEDWGYQDMPVVLETLQSTFPNQKYHLIGHSTGGLLTGLMYNCNELSSMFNFGCSSGRLKNMKPAYRIKAEFFMNILFR